MKTYFYIAAVLCVVGFVFLGLTFSALGVYALISSILLGIASLSFAQTQKKKNDFKEIIFVKAAAYTLLAASMFLFVGGLIYSAVSV